MILKFENRLSFAVKIFVLGPDILLYGRNPKC
jgi:hypothetical protein